MAILTKGYRSRFGGNSGVVPRIAVELIRHGRGFIWHMNGGQGGKYMLYTEGVLIEGYHGHKAFNMHVTRRIDFANMGRVLKGLKLERVVVEE